MTVWQNRIVGQGVKPADQFQANPNNWRKHPQPQRDALRGVLNEVGWVAQVIENVRTGHLVDGHERVWNALQNDNADVPYIQVDLSEAEEAYVLATLDPIGALAVADAAKLDELLHEVESGDAAVQTLLAELAGGAGLYAFPEIDNSDGEDTRGNRTQPGHEFMIVSVGNASARVRYDDAQRLMALIERTFGDDAEKAIPAFVGWALGHLSVA